MSDHPGIDTQILKLDINRGVLRILRIRAYLCYPRDADINRFWLGKYSLEYLEYIPQYLSKILGID